MINNISICIDDNLKGGNSMKKVLILFVVVFSLSGCLGGIGVKRYKVVVNPDDVKQMSKRFTTEKEQFLDILKVDNKIVVVKANFLKATRWSKVEKLTDVTISDDTLKLFLKNYGNNDFDVDYIIDTKAKDGEKNIIRPQELWIDIKTSGVVFWLF